MKFFIFLILTILISTSFAEKRQALVYGVGKTKESPLFFQYTEVDESQGGETNWITKIKNTEGAVVLTERATLKEDKVVYQYIEQLQIGKAYELKVEGDQGIFQTYQIADDKTNQLLETKKVRLGEMFMTGPMIQGVIRKNWGLLRDGKTLKVEFGVFELSRTVSFEFKKIRETEEMIQLEMKASNFFISLLVDSMKFSFDKAHQRMSHFLGRTPLQQKINGQWKTVDAEIVYP